MRAFSYRTILKPAEGQFKDNGSRFLAFAFPVQSEAEIRHFLEKTKKEYFDARHHCFAWMLGADKKHFRAFDGGEPNHSAGDPILGQIRSKDLTNVLVVVVRYFGGIKLGVGGLITAYKTVAEQALTRADIIEKEVRESVELVYDYSATPEVMRLVKDFDAAILSQDFGADCRLWLDFRLKDKQKLLEKLDLMRAMGLKMRYGVP